MESKWSWSVFRHQYNDDPQRYWLVPVVMRFWYWFVTSKHKQKLKQKKYELRKMYSA